MMGFGSGSKTGLTRDGVQAAVSAHCEFDALQSTDSAKHRFSVEDMYRVLIIRDTALSVDELLDYFRSPEGPGNRDQGRYAEWMAGEWWEDVGHPQLSALPGVSSNGDTWEFVGVPDASAFDDAHCRPLDDLRDDPRVRAERILDDREVPRRSDDREAIVGLWERLAGMGEATTEDLDNSLRRRSFEDVRSTLEALPGVESEPRHPPEPSDITVETMADVIDGYAALEQESTEVWRCEIQL